MSVLKLSPKWIYKIPKILHCLAQRSKHIIKSHYMLETDPKRGCKKHIIIKYLKY